MTTGAQYAPPPPPAPAAKATGGLLALGIISIVYSALFRLCCGLSAFMTSLFAMFLMSDAMRSFMDRPEMEGMPDFEAMLSGPMQSYNLIKGFVLLMLGVGMLAGGIGLIRLKPWARTLSLGVAAAEIAWAIVDFAINAFFIYPSMTQMMGDELPQTPQMIGSIFAGVFFTFVMLIYPVALLICLNLRSIKGQFGDSSGRPQVVY